MSLASSPVSPPADNNPPETKSTAPSPAIDTSAFAGKRCFVIMPYGTRTDERSAEKTTIDFDALYENVIKPAVESMVGMECNRADKTSRSGLIHREMIEEIMESDAVIVDITLLNPNVFYELGIRHAARRSGTVVIRSKHQRGVPFNINGLRVFDYDISPNAIEATQKTIATTVANSLAAEAVDSLVYQLTSSSLSIKRIGRPIGRCETIGFSHPNIPQKRLGIITGDICNVKGIDVWVNPENTRMQMGRLHDESLSACVRYLGGERDIHSRVVRDIIQMELNGKLDKHLARHVEAGAVVATSAGKLAKSHKTKAILHVAAMNGEPTKGYQLIRNFPVCITNALAEMDRLNRCHLDRYRWNKLRGKLKTIIFPLLGTRENRIEPHDVAHALVLAATNYLQDHPDTTIDAVYFLAYTDIDRSLAEHAFRRNGWTPVKDFVRPKT